MNYWLKRIREAQKNISDKSIGEVEKQLEKLYASAMKRTIKDFEATYDKVLLSLTDGREPTPADLYRLDKYWETQAQLKRELTKLGNKEIELLQKAFIKDYSGIYDAFAIKGKQSFYTVDKEAAKKLINSVWCADGKSWSDRIWTNKEHLIQTLNDELIHCVTTGKKTTELKNLLQQKFNVNYHQAKRLVETEITHIETQAAADRYKEYGIEKYKFFADADERTCEVCSGLDGKEFFLSELREGRNAPPAHPCCRCCIIPVIEDSNTSSLLSMDDKAVFKAQELTRALQDDKIALKLESKSSHHVNHAKEITGIKNEAKAWCEYNKQASDFMKLDIDGAIIQGFISKDKKMYKYDTKRNLFGVLSDEWKIITYFKPDRKLDFWFDKIRNNKE